MLVASGLCEVCKLPFGVRLGVEANHTEALKTLSSFFE